MAQIKFKVNGIKCEGCAGTIKRALAEFGEVRVSVADGTVEVIAAGAGQGESGAGLDEAAVREELEDVGFEVVARL